MRNVYEVLVNFTHYIERKRSRRDALSTWVKMEFTIDFTSYKVLNLMLCL